MTRERAHFAFDRTCELKRKLMEKPSKPAKPTGETAWMLSSTTLTGKSRSCRLSTSQNPLETSSTFFSFLFFFFFASLWSEKRHSLSVPVAISLQDLERVAELELLQRLWKTKSWYFYLFIYLFQLMSRVLLYE